MARDAGQIQTAARLVLGPAFRLLWKVTTEGLDHVPPAGGAIIAPNHVAAIDSFFVPLVLPRRITYVGKAEYLDDWKTKYLFPAMGMIPIDRSGGSASTAALDAAAAVLERGELFGIYPEGTRTRDGCLHRGHTGVARLALRTGAPIVPTAVIGTDEVQPVDATIPKFFKRVHIRFGRPIAVDRYRGRPDDRMLLRQITDEVMFEICNLSGQEYVNTYATSSTSAEPSKPVVVTPTPGTGTADPDAARTPEVPLVVSAVVDAAEVATVIAAEHSDGVARRSSTAVLQSRPF
ncbi:MAG: lysophospholipid acyltransferase family protein, partial [Actinomycetes bacterium]